MEADEVIRVLGLRPLPGEGGYFAETWRSAIAIPAAALPSGYQGPRSAGTAIYYLVARDACSRLHRLPGAEVFHFYLGDPVELLVLRPGGAGEVVVLGPGLQAGVRPQAVVPGGVWQGCRLVPGGRWALLGTTMAPGFDYEDREAGPRDALVAGWPAFADRIRALT